jgi:DNA-binding LacI/PurR family transcriptional regulator
MTAQFKAGLGKRSEEALIELRRRLDAGVYPVDSYLPVEAKLCTELGVGRSTLRRAVARLVVERRLETKRGAGTLVLKQPSKCHKSQSLATMFPLQSSVFQPLQQYALAQHVLLVPFDRPETDWSPETEKTFLECIRQAQVRGLLACCTPKEPHNDQLLADMEAEGIRVIHLEPYTVQPIDGSYIFPDYFRAGYAAASRLLLKGYSQLKYLTTGYDWPAARLAREGFLAGVQDQLGDITPDDLFFQMPMNMLYDSERREEFLRELAELPEKLGIFCHNHVAACELIGCLKDAGRKVPEEIGVLCIEYFNEPTPNVPLEMITFDREAALQQALDWVFEPDSASLQTLLPPRFIELKG